MSNSHVALSLLEQVNMLYNRVSPSIESCASRFRNNFYKVSMRANYVLLAPTTAVAAALLLRDALKMSRSSLSAMQLYITAKTEPKRKEKCGDFSTVQLVSFYLQEKQHYLNCIFGNQLLLGLDPILPALLFLRVHPLCMI